MLFQYTTFTENVNDRKAQLPPLLSTAFLFNEVHFSNSSFQIKKESPNFSFKFNVYLQRISESFMVVLTVLSG